MDKPLPDEFDPYSSAKKPPKRIHDDGQQPQKRGDDDSPEDSFFPDHERISVTTDARFTSFLNWTFGIAATLVTLGIVWIANVSVSTAAKVDVLMDRPPSVPVGQYENDMRQLKDKVTSTENKVTAIEQRQLDVIRSSQ